MAKTMIERARALGRAGLDEGALGAACHTVSRACGVKVDRALAGERLDAGECRTLVELGSRLRELPAGASAEVFPGGGPTFAQREAARGWADDLRRRKVDGGREPGKKLLLEFVDRTGRLPTGEEYRVLAPAGRDATLESLAPKLAATQPSGTWAAGGRVESVNANALSDDEQLQLEAIVEKAIDRPGYFETRRRDAVMAARLKTVRDKLKPGPRERRLVVGGLQLPPEFSRTMFEATAEFETLNLIDGAVMFFFVGAIERRELPPFVRGGIAWLEDDDRVVAHKRAFAPFGHSGVEGQDVLISLNQYQRSLKRLARYGYLEVRSEGTPRDGTTRVSYGERYRRWLEGEEL